MQQISKLRFTHQNQLDPNEAFWSLINGSKDRLLLSLIDFCNFREEWADSLPESKIKLLNKLIKTKTGDSSHRAMLFVALAKEFGFQAYLQVNNKKAFAFIKDETGYQTINFDMPIPEAQLRKERLEELECRYMGLVELEGWFAHEFIYKIIAKIDKKQFFKLLNIDYKTQPEHLSESDKLLIEIYGKYSKANEWRGFNTLYLKQTMTDWLTFFAAPPSMEDTKILLDRVREERKELAGILREDSGTPRMAGSI